MSNILITTIGRRGALTKTFKQELNKIGAEVIVTDKSPLAPALYEADKYYLTPGIYEENYIDTILEICEKDDVKAIIPLLEQSFPVYNQAREFMEEKGITLLLSSTEVIELCQDKYSFYQYFREKGIPVPETFLPEELSQNYRELPYPLFIKPRRGQGSQNTYKVNTEEELDFYTRTLEDIIIQEYLVGDEYTIDTLSDLEGRVLSAVPRKRLEVRAGEVSKAVTVKDNRLIELAVWVIEDLGIIGPANLQVKILPDGEIKLIEVNPRFGGGVPLSYQAGVNYPLLIYRMLRGEKIEPFLGEFQDGLVMLRYDTAVFKDIKDLKE